MNAIQSCNRLKRKRNARGIRFSLESLEDRECRAITFQIDYRFDTENFFADTGRRDVLQAAADDIGRRLQDTLLAIQPNMAAGNTWTARFNNPATGSQTTLDDLAIPINTYTLFVGARDLPGNTIGLGGPGGFTVAGDSTFRDTVAARGQTGALASPKTDFGPWGGSISFDSLNNWFFGTTFEPVLGAGRSDFYSVAQHEIFHAIGFGTADSFSRYVSSGTFIGPSAQTLFGGPVPLSPDEAHWAEGTTFASQAVLMDPSIPDGRRVPPNVLDLAALRDLGWQTGAITEIQFQGASFSATESGSIATITVSRTGSAVDPISVSYSTTVSGTATPGADFTVTSGTLNWAAGDAADKTFTIAITNDSLAETVETIGVQLTSATNADLGNPSTATVSIIDDDSVQIQFTSATYTVSEAGPTATITVSRTGEASSSISVQYATTNSGTATAGEDFTNVTGTLSWTANDFTNKSFTIPITNDSLNEPNETVGLQLSNTVGAGAVLGDRSTASLTITDNDANQLQFSSAVYSANESAGTISITVERLGGANGAISVEFASNNSGSATEGVDFLATRGTLNWANGDSSVKTFSVTLLNDSDLELDETIGLVLSNPTGGGAGAVLGAPANATITLTDDDANFVQFSSATFSANESAGVATIVVTRMGNTAGSVSVQYATTASGTATPGSDFTVTTGTLHWDAGDSTSKSFTIPLTSETLFEPDETVGIILSAPTGAAFGAQTTTVLTIVNDDLTIPTLFQGFTSPSDRVFGARVIGGVAKTLLFYNSDFASGESVIRNVHPLTGLLLSQFTLPDTATFNSPGDRALVGDVNGDGADELVQFNRADQTGGAGVGPALRILSATNGQIQKTIQYTDVFNGQTYAQILAGMIDPEDEVFVGRFTQKTHLEALFFNRTNQDAGATSIIVINLATGAVTDRGVHNNLNFGGFLDSTDEYTISDTNFDGLDDIVIVNRVADPTPNQSTNLGFVGMVSLANNAGGRNGADIGFYRFFDWNFAKPGERNVFPGYDDRDDHATFGRVINNNAFTSVIVLINSQFDGNPQAAAFALLQPAPLIQGVRDSFQLISTQGRSNPALVGAAFEIDDTFLLVDTNGDQTDEFVSFSRASTEISVRTYDAFSGNLLAKLPQGSSRPTTLPPANASTPTNQSTGAGVSTGNVNDSTDAVRSSETTTAWRAPSTDSRRHVGHAVDAVLELFWD